MEEEAEAQRGPGECPIEPAHDQNLVDLRPNLCSFSLCCGGADSEGRAEVTALAREEGGAWQEGENPPD